MIMAVVSLRLNEVEERTFRDYAKLTGKTLSELFKESLTQEIEDKLDYQVGLEALEEFHLDPTTYDIDEVIEELEHDL